MSSHNEESLLNVFDIEVGGLVAELGMQCVEASADRVVMLMPITEKTSQLFGLVHGGATIALLESAASWAATHMADLERERPFGIEAHIRHRKSGKQGWVRGVAEFDHAEKNKQFWNVTAYDDDGDVMSDGVFVTKIVSLERLAEIERERESRRHG